MKIGIAAEQSELPAKTIRYYEEIGLINPSRHDNGYRDYSKSDVRKLAFVQRSRNLGFSVDECRQLLALFEDKARVSADVKAIAQKKLNEIKLKLGELHKLEATLSGLVETCLGDDGPECPILDELSDERKNYVEEI